MTPLIAARRYFWGAYSFSTLGRFVHGMALSWVVWTQTHSPLWLSAIALLSALPSLPLAPVAGSMADRFHRHHILLITQTIGCVIAALTAFLSFFGYLNPYNLAVLALIFGIVTSIDGPSMHSMLVETGETVSQAVARQSLVMNVARSIAPMVAVFIIESFSAIWCFAMNAICFIPMIAVMAVVKIPNRTTSEQREESVGVTSRHDLSYSPRSIAAGGVPFYLSDACCSSAACDFSERQRIDELRFYVLRFRFRRGGCCCFDAE